MTSIGNINGKWAILFKASLIILSVCFAPGLAWASWVTMEVVKTSGFNSRGERFTRGDGDSLRLEVLRDITKTLEKHNDLPGHPVTLQRLGSLEAKAEVLNLEIDKVGNKLDRLVELTIELKTIVQRGEGEKQ